MKRTVLFILLLWNGYGYAQQDFSSFDSQQKLEDMSRKTASDPEEDNDLQQLAFLSGHPVNLNRAGREELEALVLLDPVQIDALLAYRGMLGKLIDIHELQAIPGWTLHTIRLVLPFVTLSDPVPLRDDLQARLQKGESSLLLRWGRTLEKGAGYSAGPDGRPAYAGSPDKLYLRYQYRYKNLLQWGITGDKDAGEQFVRGAQKKGFDFYSFHLFVRKTGLIKELALGDYSLNLGQGLIHWQGLSLGMGAGMTAAERQSPVLRPYSSPGESSFQRGLGITIGRKGWELTGFYSYRRLDAHQEIGPSGQPYITSFLTSGYHRTTTENGNRNRAALQTGGAVAAYTNAALHIAFSAVHYRLSIPLQKADEPYNLFAPAGNAFANAGISYRYTFRNFHLFGEVATDRHFHAASLNGLVVALHRKVDLSILHRSMSRAYQSLFGNAFTQNAQPVNERGVYAAVTLRVQDAFTVDAYADVFRFPWLKYRVVAPSAGKDYAVELTYAPSKEVELVSRYRFASKPAHQTGADSIMGIVLPETETSWRIHMHMAVSKELSLENRCEMVWFRNGKGRQQGCLLYAEGAYKPAGSPVSGSARVQYFETDAYDSRVYAYEGNVQYGFSIPAYSGTGIRYYLNMRADLTRFVNSRRGWHVDCWMKWGQTVYPGRKVLGDGPDQVRGNHKSELTLQVIIQQSR